MFRAQLFIAVILGSVALGDDRMFPPAPAAQKAIQIDGRGFVINGERTVVSSGSLHYPRVPRELWRDRLVRIERGGFNTVETYAFWNFHEPREGEWDFKTGEKNVGEFLKTAQEAGLYAIARVGPYVCAEWDFGGYPVWTKFRPGMSMRSENAVYLKYNDLWYEQILPIVTSHQIHRGGNVILVQLENEHPKGWGAVDAPPYFSHLKEKAEKLGVEVPHFMSGLNHGSGPQVRDPDTSKRATPWMTTEFWPGWFNLYGPLDAGKYRGVDGATWRILARGGAGYNFYMLHGGTNFETWNDPSGAASYDYGAAIGQAGDLRPIYFAMKRANQLARAFGNILADGSEVTKEYEGFATGANLLGARRSGAGTIVFLANPGKGEATATLKDGTALRMKGYENFPIVVSATLAGGRKIVGSSARVLGVARNEKTVTVIVYGASGDRGTLKLELPGGSESPSVSAADGFEAKFKNGSGEVRFTFPAGKASECLIKHGGEATRVVAVNSELAAYTWVVGGAGKQWVVCGPEFVSEFKEEGGKVAMVIERPYGMPSCEHVVAFGGAGQVAHLGVKADVSVDDRPAAKVGAWSMASAGEASEKFDDSKWRVSEDPEQMGIDGDTSAFAWYRAKVEMASAGAASIHLKGADDLVVMVNGKAASLEKKAGKENWIFKGEFKAGANTIAVLTSHAGRNKAYNHMGPVADFANKGLFGAVTVEVDQKKIEVKQWRMRGGVGEAKAASALGDAAGVPAFYEAGFEGKRPGATGAYPILRATFKGMTRGTMWLNGHNLGRYPEKIRVESLYLPECWLVDGQNRLVIFDETGANPAGVQLIVEKAASREVIAVSEACAAERPIVLPAVEDPMAQLAKLNVGNLAFGAKATASDSEKLNPASNATDGDVSTRWCATSAKPGHWVQVDLGSAMSFAMCEIVWEQKANRYQFTLEGSADGKTWTKLGETGTAVPTSPDSPSELTRVPVKAEKVRYVKVTGRNAGGEDVWTSVREIRVLK